MRIVILCDYDNDGNHCFRGHSRLHIAKNVEICRFIAAENIKDAIKQMRLRE